MATADYDEQGKHASGQGVVEGDNTQARLQRVLLLVDQELDTQHDDGTEASGNARRNTPGCSDLRD